MHCNCALNANKYSDLKTHGISKKPLFKVRNMSVAVRQPLIPIERRPRLNEAQVIEIHLALLITEHTPIFMCDHMNSLYKNCLEYSNNYDFDIKKYI